MNAVFKNSLFCLHHCQDVQWIICNKYMYLKILLMKWTFFVRQNSSPKPTCLTWPIGTQLGQNAYQVVFFKF